MLKIGKAISIGSFIRKKAMMGAITIHEQAAIMNLFIFNLGGAVDTFWQQGQWAAILILS
jgi:hypothetical protein